MLHQIGATYLHQNGLHLPKNEKSVGIVVFNPKREYQAYDKKSQA